MKNPEKIKKMFNAIAFDYDAINNILSFNTHKFIKEKAIEALNIKPNSKVLDLCCGSGDLGAIIKKKYPNCSVIGADFSEAMLKVAAAKNKDITYQIEDATKLSFSNNTFDYIVMGFGLRNIENRDCAISEAYRVLKKEGFFLHLDFGKKSFLSRLYDKIALFLIKKFYKDSSPFEYLINSKNGFLEPKELICEFLNKGFDFVKCKNYFFNIISFQIFKK